MRLEPPIPNIPDDAPYSNDLFSRQEFGDSLTSLLKAVDEPVVLCIDGPWGSGKTTFAKMWLADLHQRQDLHCVYYDAYAHDYADEPFVSFTAEIVSLAEEAFQENRAIQKLKEDFKSKARRIGGKLLYTGTRIGARALSCGILNNADVDALQDVWTEVTDSSSATISALIGKALEDYTHSKHAIDEFRTKLSELGAALKEEQGLPLVIVVDELDRCRPDYALALIERVKHLFSTDKVAFVLLANMEQLESYAKTIYGQGMDARAYLQKFFTLTVELPMNRTLSSDGDYCKYSRRLAEHYGLPEWQEVESFVAELLHFYRFTLREVERCLSVLSLYYAQLPNGRFTDSWLVPFLAVLRQRFPRIFIEVMNARLSCEELVESIEISDIGTDANSRFPRDRLLQLLGFLLMGQSEFTDALEAKEVDQSLLRWLERYRIERGAVLPFLCSELARFRITAAE